MRRREFAPDEKIAARASATVEETGRQQVGQTTHAAGIRWRPGEHVILRYNIFDCRWEIRPLTVVEDSPTRTALYLAAGTPCRIPQFVAARYRGEGATHNREDEIRRGVPLVNWRWQGSNVLMLSEPGAYYAVWMFRDPSTGKIQFWYVNFQEPLRRMAHGFDTRDLQLDLVFLPDGSMRVKDEDEYAESVKNGWIAPAVAQAVRDAESDAIARFERRCFPFDSEWLGWTPPPLWTLPEIPSDTEDLERFDRDRLARQPTPAPTGDSMRWAAAPGR